MTVRLVTPKGIAFEGSAEEVYAPGVIGELGILENHTLFFTPLREGKIRIKTSDKESIFNVPGGFLEVHNNIVTLVTEDAEEVKK